MSIRRFFRTLFTKQPPDSSPVPRPGQDVADHIRDTFGPLASGGMGGHMTGGGVYRMLEDEVEHHGPNEPKSPVPAEAKKSPSSD